MQHDHDVILQHTTVHMTRVMNGLDACGGDQGQAKVAGRYVFVS
jgi:hypothetical protein